MNNFHEINKRFELIKKRGFIKSNYSDSGGAGKMFETLLGKKLDNKSLPDFENIEIKTTIKCNKYPITLFSCCPIKEKYTTLDTIQYLLYNYGYNKNSICKALMINIKDGKIKYCKNGFGFMIKVSYKWEKVFLLIFYKGKILDKSISWNFSDIKDKVTEKMLNLVYIKYLKNITHSDIYYYYYQMDYYILKTFSKVMDAIKHGIISVSLNISSTSGNLRYHGINFVINEKDLSYIYDKIDIICK